MKYGQQQLELACDDLVNAIATHIQDNLCESWKVESNGTITNNPASQRNWLDYDVKNFCSDWSKCGQLIDECEIDLQHDQVGNSLHFAMDYNGDISSKHKNIKRAATIVYILINQ